MAHDTVRPIEYRSPCSVDFIFSSGRRLLSDSVTQDLLAAVRSDPAGAHDCRTDDCPNGATPAGRRIVSRSRDCLRRTELMDLAYSVLSLNAFDDPLDDGVLGGIDPAVSEAQVCISRGESQRPQLSAISGYSPPLTPIHAAISSSRVSSHRCTKRSARWRNSLRPL
jgi:hypothetical protein